MIQRVVHIRRQCSTPTAEEQQQQRPLPAPTWSAYRPGHALSIRRTVPVISAGAAWGEGGG
jgi:hypothetical protein